MQEKRRCSTLFHLLVPGGAKPHSSMVESEKYISIMQELKQKTAKNLKISDCFGSTGRIQQADFRKNRLHVKRKA